MDNHINWKFFLVPYVKAVEELKVKFKSVRKEYIELGEYSPIEFVTGRVKKVSSILDKSKRRKVPQGRIGEMIEDIAGIRIMCQFVDDIYAVVDLIRQRDGKDMTILYEKDYVRHIKESGYKSYHVIVKYPVETTTGTKDILAEIQIRTLAMNFWATIEHSINYKYSGNIPEEIKGKLKDTARTAHELDMKMLGIRDEVITAQLMFETKSKIVAEISSLISYFVNNGYVIEASNFSERLETLSEANDIEKLYSLLYEMYSFKDSINRRGDA